MNLLHAIVLYLRVLNYLYYRQHMQPMYLQQINEWCINLLQTIYNHLMIWNRFDIVQESKLVVAEPLSDLVTFRAAIIVKLYYAPAPLHFTINLVYY